MCPQYTDALSALSFSMFRGLWKWEIISHLTFKLERPSHREYVSYVLSWLDFNFIKNYLDQKTLTKTLTVSGTDERTDGRTDQRTDRQRHKPENIDGTYTLDFSKAVPLVEQDLCSLWRLCRWYKSRFGWVRVTLCTGISYFCFEMLFSLNFCLLTVVLLVSLRISLFRAFLILRSDSFYRQSILNTISTENI